MVEVAFTRRVSPTVLDQIKSGTAEQLRLLARMATEHDYYTFEPRPDCPQDYDEQESFVNDSDSKFCILLGGNGSGKTLAAAYKTARYVLETPPPARFCPFWVMGENFEQICQVAWVEKLSKLIPESEILDVQWYMAKRRWPRAVMLRHPEHRDQCGWVLEFRSYEQGIGAIKAVSIGGYWCNEEVPFEQIAEIQARCRDYDSPGWADFTPIECRSAEWPDAYENPPDGWRFYHVNTEKNWAISQDWITRFLKTIPADMRETRRIGTFSVLRGAVYKEFRKSIHVVEPFAIPRDWFKFRGIDFGFNNEFCCLWIARSPDGIYYVYDEHYAGQRMIAWHAEEIKSREWSKGPYWGTTYSDHDPQVRAELANHDIECTPANKSINAGIECVRSLMMLGDNGKPRLYIFSNCENLIREIPAYRWPDASANRSAAEVPIDKDNHALDAMRYVLYTERLKMVTSREKIHKKRVMPDSSRHGVQFRRD